MNDGVGLIVEVDEWRARRRLEHRYLDEVAEDIDEALKRVAYFVEQGQPRSIGLIGNAADVFPELLARNAIPDIVTDQTPAHDYLTYFPHEMSFEDANALKEESPEEFIRLSGLSMAKQ